MSKRFGIIVTIISCIAIILSVTAIAVSVTSSNHDGEKDIQYVMYLGTNDRDTNMPVFTEDQAKAEAEKILIKHFGGYTIQDARGGWSDEGRIYQEYTIVIYLSDTTLDAVHAAADEMIPVFKQSAVLIQSNETTTEFYAGK